MLVNRLQLERLNAKIKVGDEMDKKKGKKKPTEEF